jgi:hypothetical protein
MNNWNPNLELVLTKVIIVIIILWITVETEKKRKIRGERKGSEIEGCQSRERVCQILRRKVSLSLPFTLPIFRSVAYYLLGRGPNML